MLPIDDVHEPIHRQILAISHDLDHKFLVTNGKTKPQLSSMILLITTR
jgi:hypothetical protein